MARIHKPIRCIVLYSFTRLTLSVLQTKTDTCANSVDPDETACNKLSHQDLHCLPSYYLFWTEIPKICISGHVKIRWKSPLEKLRDERVKRHRTTVTLSLLYPSSTGNKVWHVFFFCCFFFYEEHKLQTWWILSDIMNTSMGKKELVTLLFISL